MKLKYTLIFAILFCNVAQAQVSVDRLKGTWALAALCSKDTNIAVLYSQDTIIRSLISNTYKNPVFMYRYNSGKYQDYWFNYLQYVSFDKKEMGLGYAKDSTYTKREKGYQGKYVLRNSTLETPFLVFRDWQKVNMFAIPVEYQISFEGDFLVLISKGGQIRYFKQVNKAVLFRD